MDKKCLRLYQKGIGMIWDEIKNIDGWLGDKQAELLYKYALKCKGNILELGSFCGKSSVVLAEAAKKNNKIVICADLFPTNCFYKEGNKWITDTLVEFNKNIKDYDNIFSLRIDHNNLRGNLNGKFGLVYVDGDHIAQNIIPDANYAYYLSDKYVVFHDYGQPVWSDVKICVDVLINKWGPKNVIIKDEIAIIEK